MALTITYDGYGVVANADQLTNDTGGSGTGDWRELGGGSYSLSPDASKYGTDSIGSKYASKTGYTYIDGITALDFSGGGAQEGEYIYIWVMTLSPTPLDTLVNTPYNICIGDSTGTFNEYTVASKADSNGWDGRWRVFVIDPTITPTIDRSADISAIDTIGVWHDTNVSVRAESFFISQIMCAKGLKVEGTSTTMYDDIVAWAEDYSNRAAGMFQSRGQTYYSLGSLVVHSDTANTTVSADGSNVEYEKCEFYTGSAWATSYPTDANLITVEATGGNTCSLTDANIGLAGNNSNNVSIDTSTATSYSKTGGYLKYLSTMSSTANDLYSGVVFSLYDARTLGAESYEVCTFDGSTTLTVGSTADFASNNVINGISAVNSLSVTDLSYISTNKINSSGSNHGVELTSIGGGTMSWNCITNDFNTGSAGSPITPTSTGNETIYVNVGSGTLTINVAAGSTLPSVRSAGATVNVVSSFTLTLTDIITGTQVTIVDSTTRSELQNSTSTGTDITYSHPGGNEVDILLMHLDYDPNNSDIYDLTLDTGDQSIKFQQGDDRNYDNPDVAPVYVSSEVGNIDNTSLILTYNLNLDTGSVPATTDFSVNDGAANTVTNVAISGYTVDLTLTNAISNGDTVTVSYTKGTNPIQGTATVPNESINLTTESVTNNIATAELYPQTNAASIDTEVDATTEWTEVSTTITSITDTPYDGTYNLKLESTSTNGSDRGIFTISVTNGIQYNVSIWCKMDAGNIGSPTFRAWTGFSDFTTQAISNTAWTEYTWTITANITGSAEFRAYCADSAVAAGQIIFIDAISISEA